MLPYSVFRAIARRYHLSARWLAGMDNSPQIENEFDDTEFSGKIKDRMLFTEVYDTYLCTKLEAESNASFEEFLQDANKLGASFKDVNFNELPPETRQLIKQKVIIPLAKFFGHVSQGKKFQKKIDSNLASILALDEYSPENDLTNKADSLTTGDVQPVLPKLIKRLRRATEARGKKSELADWLGVHRQMVTDWLSGKQEPGGETTLRLLHWVEQQECKK